ncbi:hypothetical protein CNMCM8980_003200 [Aspergillus fumigatiaffinis]|nr:hypothetical protein CNMCM8980_003200 [Aspergillus fumigatiaffinis]
MTSRLFRPVYQQGDPGSGIGGYDLKSGADRALSFDYDHSGKCDHLVLYRPGTGTIWILKNNDGVFHPVYNLQNGIGGYDLRSGADQVFAFDYDHSGKLDHLVLYRPGTGTIWILKNRNGVFHAVYRQGDPGSGIGGYDLKSSSDRAFAFDYDHSGKLDHLVLYRPGTGTIWILKNRNGTGTIWILKNRNGVFHPVYQQGDPGRGIGGYDLSGKLDDLALYRPGTGTIWILKNRDGVFHPVYQQGDPGSGIGGYDLKSGADRAFTFDYNHHEGSDYATKGKMLLIAGLGYITILSSLRIKKAVLCWSPILLTANADPYAHTPPGMDMNGPFIQKRAVTSHGDPP